MAKMYKHIVPILLPVEDCSLWYIKSLITFHKILWVL